MSIRIALVSFVLIGSAVDSTRADNYAVDPAHSAAVFRVSHLGLSWVYGRFKDLSGSFTIDPQNPAATHFELSARVESIDTDNAQRDQHLKSPDFFNAKQFPMMTFRSTGTRPIEGGYELTGELTLHGITKPLTMVLRGGRAAEFPRGTQRTGFVGEFSIKRSDFGMSKMLEAVGDDVHVSFSFEGVKK